MTTNHVIVIAILAFLTSVTTIAYFNADHKDLSLSTKCYDLEKK